MKVSRYDFRHTCSGSEEPGIFLSEQHDAFGQIAVQQGGESNDPAYGSGSDIPVLDRPQSRLYTLQNMAIYGIYASRRHMPPAYVYYRTSCIVYARSTLAGYANCLACQSGAQLCIDACCVLVWNKHLYFYEINTGV